MRAARNSSSGQYFHQGPSIFCILLVDNTIWHNVLTIYISQDSFEQSIMHYSCYVTKTDILHSDFPAKCIKILSRAIMPTQQINQNKDLLLKIALGIQRVLI
jgi:hypothetical protein